MIHVIHIYIFFMLENDNTSQQTTGQAWTRIHSMPHFIFIADCIKADLVALQSFYSADLRIYHWNRNLQHIRSTSYFQLQGKYKTFLFSLFWMNTNLYLLLFKEKKNCSSILQSSMKGNDKQNKKYSIITFKDYNVSVRCNLMAVGL